MYQPRGQDVTSHIYPIPHLFSGSSTEQTDINEILDNLFSTWVREIKGVFYFYQSLLPVLELDLSSVCPRFEIKSETSMIEIKEISEEIIVAGMIKDDFIVKMPPIREHTLRVKIKSIEKAHPHIVEPEGV